MKSILLILVASAVVPAEEPSEDPFAPKAAINEFVLKRDQDAQSSIPDEFAFKDGVSIRVKSIEEDGIVFMLINNTDSPVYYSGTGITSPWFRLQIPWKAGELRDAIMDRWCGTGLYLPKLVPKRCCSFKVATKEPKFRVGIDFWQDDRIQEDQKKTVWSDIVNKNGEQAAPSDADKPSN